MPSGAPLESTSPPAVKAAAGPARRPGMRASKVSMRELASLAEPALAGHTLLPEVQAVATMRTRSGRGPAASSTLNAADTVPPSLGTTGAPLDGQLQAHPVSVCQQAACSDRIMPASSQVVGTHPPGDAPPCRWCARNDTALASLSGRQSVPMFVLSFSLAIAQPMPASAASKAWVDRYCAAEAPASTATLRWASTATSSIAKASRAVTTSVATPRCHRRSLSWFIASAFAVADHRRRAQAHAAANAVNDAGVVGRVPGDLHGEVSHLLPRRARRARSSAGCGTEAGQADFVDSRLDVECRDDERRRIGQCLPVRIAELELDRAAAQSKAETLVAVDDAVFTGVAGKAETNRGGCRRVGGDGAVGIDDRSAAVIAAHAGRRRSPEAGAAQVARHDVGRGAQILSEARVDQHGAALTQMLQDER